MRFELVAVMIVASCLPAIATPPVPQGSISVVRGRAHVEEGAEGTYVKIDSPGATRPVTGFIPFGDKPTFPYLSEIEGRTVDMGGVVVVDGALYIVLTDPNQLAIVN
jgi:hypothetical protein